jgi:hypothetical protein
MGSAFRLNESRESAISASCLFLAQPGVFLVLDPSCASGGVTSTFTISLSSRNLAEGSCLILGPLQPSHVPYIPCTCLNISRQFRRRPGSRRFVQQLCVRLTAMSFIDWNKQRMQLGQLSKGSIQLPV